MGPADWDTFSDARHRHASGRKESGTFVHSPWCSWVRRNTESSSMQTTNAFSRGPMRLPEGQGKAGSRGERERESHTLRKSILMGVLGRGTQPCSHGDLDKLTGDNFPMAIASASSHRPSPLATHARERPFRDVVAVCPPDGPELERRWLSATPLRGCVFATDVSFV